MTEQGSTPDRIARVIRASRRSRGWSVDRASTAAGIAGKTWQRVEDALAVRAESWRRVAVALDLPEGALLDVLFGGGDLDALQAQLGMRGPVARTLPAPERPAAASSAAPELPRSVVALVGLLLSELAGTERTAAADEVLGALAGWLPELAKVA